MIKGKDGNWYGVGKERGYRFVARNTKTAHFNSIMSREDIFANNPKGAGRSIVNAIEKQMGEALAKKWK